MPNFLARSVVAVLLAFQIVTSTLAFVPQETRQRRIQTQAEPQKNQTLAGEWPTPKSESITLSHVGDITSSQQEPTIRVALATDVRSATVSTAGHLLNAS